MYSKDIHIPIYGDSFFEFFLELDTKKKNSTLQQNFSETATHWTVYQYGMCSLFLLAACFIVFPLLQKRNYKSKHRKQILLVDGLMLFFCLSRIVTLFFSCTKNAAGAGCIIFMWTLGSTLLVISLAVFLFILWTTTKLRSITWKMKNTSTLVAFMVSNLITVILKELLMFLAVSENVGNWMINFLLLLSLANGFLFFGLGFYCCGTFRQMNQNREPSIRLVRETSKSKSPSQLNVVYTDVKNFRSMVQKLRIVAFVAFLRFAITFYLNAKLLYIYNSYENHEIYAWEFWGLEIALRIIELIIVMITFCVGFFSPQHKEAARQWIRGFSISRSHDDLSTRRTMSLDSNRETISETRSRTGTLTIDTGYSDNSNETVSLSGETISSPLWKASDNLNSELISSLFKQDANYLMVPHSFPPVIEMVVFKENTRIGKKRMLLEAVDENTE